LTGLNILTLKLKNWIGALLDTLPANIVPGEFELLQLAGVSAVSDTDATVYDTLDG